MGFQGFIGVDPGVTCGVCWATYDEYGLWDVHAASCNFGAMTKILVWQLSSWRDLGIPVLLQGEEFRTGNQAGAKGKNADFTREALREALDLGKHYGATVVTHTAADVMSWASDKRLKAIGFPLAPKMKDARAAGRHMMYGAVRSGRALDPLR